ncbi:MAG: hypothetical protein ACKO23_15685 [Gemmataceae bacterium]
MPGMLFISLLAFQIGSPFSSQGEMVGSLWSSDQESNWCCENGVPYSPNEGDIVFFSSMSPIHFLIYKFGGTCHPYHVGIVVRNPEGSLCVFESGAKIKFGVTEIPLPQRMNEYLLIRPYRRIWVRKIKEPLNPEQSRCLTDYAESQCGKKFACFFRMGLMGIPGRPLKPTEWNQDRWFCAELVSETIRYCGLCPCCWIRPEKTSPRDLFKDERNIGVRWHSPKTWSPDQNPPPPGPLFSPP